MATPFPFYKQIASHLGGTRNGLVISWPKGIAARGLRTQYAHVTDIYPTLLDAAGIAAPDKVDGIAQQPLGGASLAYSFADAGAPSRHNVQYYEMLGNRSIYADGWLAATLPVREPWHMASAPDANINRAPGYRWSLFDLDHDFNQTHDLSARYPNKLAAMQRLFDEQAARNQVYPVNDRTDFARIMSANAAYGRKQSRYTYWGKGLTVALDDAPPIGGRAFTITADITGGEGVLLATGSRLGGWSFAIENGRPAAHQALTPLPTDRFDLVSPEAIAPGSKARVSFDFAYDGGGFGKGGTVSIAIDGRTVASGRVEHSLLIADPHAESFDIGLDSGVPVVETGGRSNAYTGEMEKLVVDIGPPGQKRP